MCSWPLRLIIQHAIIVVPATTHSVLLLGWRVLGPPVRKVTLRFLGTRAEDASVGAGAQSLGRFRWLRHTLLVLV